MREEEAVGVLPFPSLSFPLPFILPLFLPPLLPSLNKRESPLGKAIWDVWVTEQRRKKDHSPRPGSTQKTITIISPNLYTVRYLKKFMSLGLKAGVLQVVGEYRSLNLRSRGSSQNWMSCVVLFPVTGQKPLLRKWGPWLFPSTFHSCRCFGNQQHPTSLGMLLSCTETAVPHWCPWIFKQKNNHWWSSSSSFQILLFLGPLQ